MSRHVIIKGIGATNPAAIIEANGGRYDANEGNRGMTGGDQIPDDTERIALKWKCRLGLRAGFLSEQYVHPIGGQKTRES